MADVNAILKGVDLGLSILIPYVRDLLAKRRELVAIREAGGDVSDAQWTARDLEMEAVLGDLEEVLRPEDPPPDPARTG